MTPPVADRGCLIPIDDPGTTSDLRTVRGGRHDGYQFVLHRAFGFEPGYSYRPLEDQINARRRSLELLWPMLDQRQQIEVRTAGEFWEWSPPGWLRVDTLGILDLRPTNEPWTTRKLCIHTLDASTRPPADELISLLISFRADAGAFISAANTLGTENEHGAHHKLGPHRSETLEHQTFLRQLRKYSWDSRLFLSAAFYDFDLSHNLQRLGQENDALGPAIAAVAVIEAQATVYASPEIRSLWRIRQRPIYDLASELAQGVSHLLVEYWVRHWFAMIRKDMMSNAKVDDVEAEVIEWLAVADTLHSLLGSP